MINITLPDGKIVHIYNLYEEITIGQFERVIICLNKKYDSFIEQFTEIVSIISDLTIEDIDELDIDVVNSIMKNLEFLNQTQPTEYIKSIEIDEVIYSANVSDKNEFKFKTKEIKAVEKSVANNSTLLIGEYAAVIFVETENNVRNGNLEQDSIKKRAELFRNKMPMHIINPYLAKLGVHYQQLLNEIKR